MHISKIRLAGSALVFAIVFAIVGAVTQAAVQNHMLGARNYLNSALSELQQAQPDKGGHRNSAINYVKDAINQVNLGIQYAK
jgi:hypothetical protein